MLSIWVADELTQFKESKTRHLFREYIRNNLVTPFMSLCGFHDDHGDAICALHPIHHHA